MRLLLATSNAGKTVEMKDALDGLGYEVVSLVDLDPVPAAPAEIFDTFAENALLKARHYREFSGYLSLADDSGLVVDALGGAPGVQSARYAGSTATSAELIDKLLSEIAEVKWEDRSARFVSVIAIAGRGFERVFEGTCEGRILFEPRGQGGFGYDPVFYDLELSRTFAEMTVGEKALRSHRGQALVSARDFLFELKDS